MVLKPSQPPSRGASPCTMHALLPALLMRCESTSTERGTEWPFSGEPNAGSISEGWR
jgi:hypothetical protein